MLMQNFGLTNKEYYGMSGYFLEWSITNHGSFYDFANHKVGKLPVTARHIVTIFLRDYDVQVCD